ncbi:MAG: hypothetical protein UV74_C0013G0562 [Candidatus Woesebacteria bacterium GW2011_GWB1_43_14]|uniref:Uncharacterized protein n=1 Tax=Candidatus Woesebacteria bacterium GW2011_GWB1_43_14 TaxID=1618578 RepID=A0A0G1DHU7_9BACT|nr:MAG: hypothetical protein UT21_C0001G0275 [Candidatus Woesebacteria bacterium GW2011_GWA1_39_11b]KKS77981.1 MAG: hypothetical protein UV51_C0003G0016 [Candidatus Woesebacteria bacterium GW2011_GWC1_42_9]KKS97440.1 MAG: hypothetical protein UV74_C0013G0562 [Candidatus Woesebacteria bacterium GW2011_GWB1_43_14]
MLDFIKRNKVTVIILVSTLVLGGIAIFTAVRLYSLRSQRVAPSAPESIPGAAAPTLTNTCDLTFTTTAETAGCNDPCTDDTDCTEANHTCVDTDDDGVDDSCRLTAYPDEIDCQAPVVPDSCNDSCTTNAECVAVDPDFTCSDTDDAGNLRCRLDENPDSTTCQPADNPQCNDTCDNNSDCPTSMVCDSTSDTCRNPDCRAETDCVCAEVDEDIVCNDACTNDNECPSGMDCVSNRCRNPQCDDETDCTCSLARAATPTATPSTSLPDAGVSTPTFVGVGAAILLFVGALILVL